MNIDEQLETHSQDPAMVELRAWRDQQRAPLSEEEIKHLAEVICNAAVRASLWHIRVIVRTEMRKVLLFEWILMLLALVIGVGVAKWLL